MEKIMFAVVAECVDYGRIDSKIVSIHPTREEAENVAERIRDKIREATTLHRAVKTMMKAWDVRNPSPCEDKAGYSAWCETRYNEEDRLLQELNLTKFPHKEERVTVMEVPMLNPEKAVEAWDSWVERCRFKNY